MAMRAMGDKLQKHLHRLDHGDVEVVKLPRVLQSGPRRGGGVATATDPAPHQSLINSTLLRFGRKAVIEVLSGPRRNRGGGCEAF